MSASSRALKLGYIETTAQRIVRYPAATAGVNIVSDGAAAATAYCANWIQIVAAATIANPCWIIGIVLGTPQVEAFYGDITIGTGAAAAEVTLVTIPVGTDLFPVVEWAHPIIWLPAPGIQVLGTPRLAVNIRKNTAASAAGFNNCAVLARTGMYS
jgi:hypothetical protein